MAARKQGSWTEKEKAQAKCHLRQSPPWPEPKELWCVPSQGKGAGLSNPFTGSWQSWLWATWRTERDEPQAIWLHTSEHNDSVDGG